MDKSIIIINEGNIKTILVDYIELMKNINMDSLKEDKGYSLLHKLKREKCNIKPYENVSFFELANRVLSDLVILKGIYEIYTNHDYKEFRCAYFNIDLGHDNTLSHDIIGYNSTKEIVLIGEAFNVSKSLFTTKINKTLKKLTNSKIQKEPLKKIVVYNSDATDTDLIINSDIKHIKIDLNNIEEFSNKLNIK